ncbi:MAG: helix-turn-helix domain-containing protein [Anaerolineales bacterium]
MSKQPICIHLDGCPVAKTARLIGRKWVLLIIRDLAEGPRRFTALQQSLQVNPRTLSQRLSQLEAEGVIRRQCYAEVPPRVEYSLLDKGTALVPILKEMRRFGNKWL